MIAIQVSCDLLEYHYWFEFPKIDHVILFQQYNNHNNDTKAITDRVITLVNAVDAVRNLKTFFDYFYFVPFIFR